MRSRLRPDVVSLASGAVVAALGALVLADSAGLFDVTMGWIAVAVSAGIGLILLLSGLAGDGEARHD